MNPTTIISIDPGASGGFVIDDPSFEAPIALQFRGFADVASLLVNVGKSPVIAVIEEVHSSPIMSRASAFSFGQNFGEWLGILRAIAVPTYGVRPQEWQYNLRIAEKGPARKRALKELCKQRHIQRPVTLNTCDALLISDWARANFTRTGVVGGKKIL